jgi:hypothetical protein
MVCIPCGLLIKWPLGDQLLLRIADIIEAFKLALEHESVVTHLPYFSRSGGIRTFLAHDRALLFERVASRVHAPRLWLPTANGR